MYRDFTRFAAALAILLVSSTYASLGYTAGVMTKCEMFLKDGRRVNVVNGQYDNQVCTARAKTCASSLGSTYDQIVFWDNPHFLNGPLENCTAAVAPSAPTPSVPRPVAVTAEWQINAKWCVDDRGSSHTEYISNCQRMDQYHSVIGCQLNAKNQKAVGQLEAAGAATVNAFMASIRDPRCNF